MKANSTRLATGQGGLGSCPVTSCVVRMAVAGGATRGHLARSSRLASLFAPPAHERLAALALRQAGRHGPAVATRALQTTEQAAGTRGQVLGAVVLNFHVTGPPDLVGDVRIVGNIPALGNWIPEKGVLMQRVSQHLWSAACVMPDDFQGCIEFKAVELPSEGGGVPSWEDGQNRRLQVAGASSASCTTFLDVSCEWGKDGLSVKLSRPAEGEQPFANGNGSYSAGSSAIPAPQAPAPVLKEVRAGDLVPVRLIMTIPEPLPPGHQLVLVGGAAELGGWDVARGAFLTPVGPHTLAADTDLPCGIDVEYKVVTLVEGQAPFWEEGGNRVLHVPLPSVDDGPGRMALMLHHDNPGLMITVYDQACRGDLEPLRAELPATCHVTVPVYHVTPGQQLVLVGSLPELGDWNPDAGLVLATAETGFWEGSMEVPLGTTAEAKLVVRDAAGGLFWEDGPNRVLCVAGGLTTFSKHAIGAITCITLLPSSGAPPPTLVFPVYPIQSSPAPSRSRSPEAAPQAWADTTPPSAYSGRDDGYAAGKQHYPSGHAPGANGRSNALAGLGATNNGARPATPLKSMDQLEARLARLKANLLDAAEDNWSGEASSATADYSTTSASPYSTQPPPPPATTDYQGPYGAVGGSGSADPDSLSQQHVAEEPVLQPSAWWGGGVAPEEEEAPPPQPDVPAVDDRPIWMQLEDAGLVSSDAGSPSPSPSAKKSPSPPPAWTGAALPVQERSPEAQKLARGRPTRPRGSGAPAASPKAAVAAPPEGMEVYEDHVIGILSACPNRTLDEVHDLLILLDLPPKYDKTQAQLSGLLKHMVEKGSVAESGVGLFQVVARRAGGRRRTGSPDSTPEPRSARRSIAYSLRMAPSTERVMLADSASVRRRQADSHELEA